MIALVAANDPKPKQTRNKKKIRKKRYKGNPENNSLKKAWQDPEYRAKHLARLKAGLPGAGRPPGVPDGMSQKTYLKLKAAADIKTQKVMKAMTKIFEADNDVAKKAIETAVNILNLPGAHQLRLQAAKTLLDFTQRKPVTASELNLKTAENFLDELASQEDNDK